MLGARADGNERWPHFEMAVMCGSGSTRIEKGARLGVLTVLDGEVLLEDLPVPKGHTAVAAASTQVLDIRLHHAHATLSV